MPVSWVAWYLVAHRQSSSHQQKPQTSTIVQIVELEASCLIENSADALPKYQATQLTGIAAGRVMPIVMQLYATDRAASHQMLNRF